MRVKEIPNQKKSVLVLAYEFYPVNTGGSHRPFRMAKFLKNNGYNPIVLTADDEIHESKADPTLRSELDQLNIQVVRSKIDPINYYSRLSTSYYINTVDDTLKRWKKYLCIEVEKLLKTMEIGSVIMTAPPFSVATFSRWLKKEFPRLTIILDMRDAWSNWNVTPYASKVHYWATLKEERLAFRHADHVLVTSKVTLEDFQENHPKINPDKFHYIPNSFDSYQLRQVTPKISSKIKIGYVGSFYYEPYRDFLLTAKWYQKKPHQWLQYLPYQEEWLYRSPYFLFKSLRTLFNLYPEYREKIEVSFAGSKPEWFDSMIEQFKLDEVVNHMGRLDKSQVVRLEQTMDYLLITSAKRHHKKDYSIAGKTFEYLSLKKPILAFVTESAQKDILEHSGLAVVIDPDDVKSACRTLKKLIDKEIDLTANVSYCDQFLTVNTLAPLKKIL